MQKWYELFRSEHAAVYLLSVKILFANTKNDWVPTQQWRHSYIIVLYK